MKKKFNVFSKRSPDISLQHKNVAIHFLKKKLLHLAENMAGGERVN